MKENLMIETELGISIKFRNVEEVLCAVSRRPVPIYYSDFVLTCYYELQKEKKLSKHSKLRKGIVVPQALQKGIHSYNMQRINPIKDLTQEVANDLCNNYFSKNKDRFYYPVIKGVITQVFDKPQISLDGIEWNEFEANGFVYLLRSTKITR